MVVAKVVDYFARELLVSEGAPMPTRETHPENRAEHGTKAKKKLIGEMLVEGGFVEQGQVDEAIRMQEERGGKVGEILIDLGYLDVQTFALFLAKQPGVPSIDISQYRTSSELYSLIPADFAVTHEIFPIDKMGKLLTVGMLCPLDSATIEELEHLTGLKVSALLCDPTDIRNVIREHYQREGEAASDADPASALSRIESTVKLQNVAKLLRHLDTLPTLPRTVEKVRNAIEDPDVSVGDVSDIISLDPPIVARLLKLANSAAYGFASRVDSVRLACSLLGLQELAVVVLSSAVVDIIEKSKHIDYARFLDRSIFCATAARQIAKARARDSAGGAFTSGLLHDIGRFALAEAVPARYAKIDKSLEGDTLLGAEEEALGIAHPEAGYILARNWQFPEEIAEAIRFHHTPDLAVEAKDLAAIVALAALLAEAGDREQGLEEDRLALLAPVLKILEFDEADALGIYEDTVTSLQEDAKQ